ncbi:hypothetical protein HYH02_007929 [Chlamydomonas schloesseri]|uniref:SGNH hydrolase-type esterase domain-containing protein n=1 Tax=Chlamydomonas schloesseri TaxID=2026947 RepID=A0A836B461_9CHLO|nr:hypothetical protein HYH02_007929 [Chlamydomonas schloesseri]|eukprot:KAG2447186.1 hypothetical protein HYH02_007929 [Chlamydomonas schloesseri]
MGGTVENYTDPGTVASGQCGPRYTGMVEFAAAACNKHEYKPGLFRMLVDAHHRQLGQSALGDRGRLLAALQRYRDGDNLTVAVIGGSIAAGQGAFDAPAFPYWLKLILEAQLPGGPQRVRMNNGAVPGTSSAYMSTCHNVHVPPNADIVILDYAVNDEEMPMPHMNNGVRRPFERLIRKVLQYPRRPAVVLMHAYRWFQIPVENTGQFWVSSERQHGEFGSYYGLQQLSVKACCYHLMQQGADGFAVKRPRADHHGRLQHENFIDAMLKGRAFYFDVVHPDGNTGHRVMGELAAQLVLDAWAQVSSGYNISAEDVARINKPLPPPMLAYNFESRSDKCFIGPALQQTVVGRQGFEWINEGKTAKLPKWGYIAETPGAEIKFKVNTNSTTVRRQELTVELGYLRSYENMGKAVVSCEGGCKCTPWTLEGHHDQRNTQTFLHGWRVSQADECIIVVKVLEASNSGKHKVKISGLMVSEDPENLPFNNWAAWDWVSVASSKDPSGVFEIKNVARRSLLAAHQASSARLQQRYAALYGAGGAQQQQQPQQGGAWEEAEWGAAGEQAAGLQAHADDGIGSATLRGV